MAARGAGGSSADGASARPPCLWSAGNSQAARPHPNPQIGGGVCITAAADKLLRRGGGSKDAGRRVRDQPAAGRARARRERDAHACVHGNAHGAEAHACAAVPRRGCARNACCAANACAARRPLLGVLPAATPRRSVPAATCMWHARAWCFPATRSTGCLPSLGASCPLTSRAAREAVSGWPRGAGGSALAWAAQRARPTHTHTRSAAATARGGKSQRSCPC